MKFYMFLLIILLINIYGNASRPRLSLNTTDAVSKAAKYLLKRTEPDEGWKNSLPRTVVALAFAVKSRTVPDGLLSSLRKELNMHIFMKLSQTRLKTSLFELAQYINALYATCQDPRSFHGMNLVEQLRSDVEFTWNRSSNEFSPFPLLTLCIVGDIRSADKNRLNKILYQTEKDKLSLKALAWTALACCSSVKEAREHKQVLDFITDVRLEFNTTDVYTKSLSLQAFHALYVMGEKEREAKLSLLLQNQLSDGSFGDRLSTYYAIPALLNKSLLDLTCQYSGIEGRLLTYRLRDSLRDAIGKVTYSLWIDQGTQSITHSIEIGLNRNETFYDVMRKAGEENEIFRFLYDSTKIGKKVYSLAGIPNNAESREAWNLYRGFEDNVMIFSKENLIKQTAGVDQIWPRYNDHFVFWFERGTN